MWQKHDVVYLFWSLLYSWLTVTVWKTKILQEKLNFEKQIFAMELISISFAEFSFAIWDPYCENKFHEYWFS